MVVKIRPVSRTEVYPDRADTSQNVRGPRG